MLPRGTFSATGIKRNTLFNENKEPIHYNTGLSCLAITQANALIPHGQLQPTAAHLGEGILRRSASEEDEEEVRESSHYLRKGIDSRGNPTTHVWIPHYFT